MPVVQGRYKRSLDSTTARSGALPGTGGRHHPPRPVVNLVTTSPGGTHADSVKRLLWPLLLAIAYLAILAAVGTRCSY